MAIKPYHTAQKMKFSIEDFSSKCDQIRRKRRIWSYLSEKSLMKNFIFCVVSGTLTVLTMNFTVNKYPFKVTYKKTTQQIFNCTKFRCTQSYQ